MRSISSTLESNQKSVGVDGNPQDFIWKIVLTRSGQDTKTYTKTRILSISHSEEDDSGVATVILDNSDGTLTSLNFERYKCVISYGFNDPTQGDEYSPVAPLFVDKQTFLSAEGVLICRLLMIGIPNQMGLDKAESEYTQESDDGTTATSLITSIVNGTLTTFSNYISYFPTFDSSDPIIGSFTPADYFIVRENDNRLDKVVELLGWTGEKMRAEDDGKIHFFDPTISGASFDYEYKLLVAGEHTFFNKELSNRFVQPNKVVVKSRDAHSPQYSGSATSATSFALDSKIETIKLRLPSNALAASIAAARIESYELNAETGAVEVPMNVGQEVWDYIKVTDSRQGDTRTGNVRFITRTVSIPGRGGSPTFRMFIGFGTLTEHTPFASVESVAGISRERGGTRELDDVIRTFNERILLNTLAISQLRTELFLGGVRIPRLHVTEELIIPVET